MPPAVTANEARDQLGYGVSTYLEAGPCSDPIPSSIVDCTGPAPRVLRDGAIPFEKLREVVPNLQPFVLAQPLLPGLPELTPAQE
jgi:tRNA A37 threonylcarbamoyladenosine synthetase subunit TsaC/SUA5/YrdC